MTTTRDVATGDATRTSPRGRVVVLGGEVPTRDHSRIHGLLGQEVALLAAGSDDVELHVEVAEVSLHGRLTHEERVGDGGALRRRLGTSLGEIRATELLEHRSFTVGDPR